MGGNRVFGQNSKNLFKSFLCSSSSCSYFVTLRVLSYQSKCLRVFLFSIVSKSYQHQLPLKVLECVTKDTVNTSEMVLFVFSGELLGERCTYMKIKNQRASDSTATMWSYEREIILPFCFSGRFFCGVFGWEVDLRTWRSKTRERVIVLQPCEAMRERERELEGCGQCIIRRSEPLSLSPHNFWCFKLLFQRLLVIPFFSFLLCLCLCLCH